MERMKMTESEKIAATASDNDFISFNMNEKNIDKTLKKEESFKLNAQIDSLEEQLEQHKNDFNKAVEDTPFNTETAEIKPMFNRILIKPFKINPFQKTVQENGIITDLGGYNPNLELNPISGKYEEMDQFIITGLVVEVGPETKYIKEGDVVYFRKDTAVPVPFFKQGFVSLGESQIIAQVAENLTERFAEIKKM